LKKVMNVAMRLTKQVIQAANPQTLPAKTPPGSVICSPTPAKCEFQRDGHGNGIHGHAVQLGQNDAG
jgi:hypothetical protein